MRCYLRQGEFTQAIATYHRCRQKLAFAQRCAPPSSPGSTAGGIKTTTLGIMPSAKTQSLLQALNAPAITRNRSINSYLLINKLFNFRVCMTSCVSDPGSPPQADGWTAPSPP